MTPTTVRDNSCLPLLLALLLLPLIQQQLPLQGGVSLLVEAVLKGLFEPPVVTLRHSLGQQNIRPDDSFLTPPKRKRRLDC